MIKEINNEMGEFLHGNKNEKIKIMEDEIIFMAENL